MGTTGNYQLPRELSMPGRIRTPDLLIRSQTLYPAELRAQIHLGCYPNHIQRFHSFG